MAVAVALPQKRDEEETVAQEVRRRTSPACMPLRISTRRRNERPSSTAWNPWGIESDKGWWNGASEVSLLLSSCISFLSMHQRSHLFYDGAHHTLSINAPTDTYLHIFMHMSLSLPLYLYMFLCICIRRCMLRCQPKPSRFSKDKPRFIEPLDVIKFLCKDLWTLIFRKQIDNLKTNHRVRCFSPCIHLSAVMDEMYFGRMIAGAGRRERKFFHYILPPPPPPPLSLSLSLCVCVCVWCLPHSFIQLTGLTGRYTSFPLLTAPITNAVSKEKTDQRLFRESRESMS